MIGLGLEGKRVLITGAAGGLGRAFAEAFASTGAKVVVSDINADGVEQTAPAIADGGGEAHACPVDVISERSTIALAAFALAKLGGLDCLVNNAAIYAGLARKRFDKIPETEWDRVMSVNVKGNWLMSKAGVA